MEGSKVERLDAHILLPVHTLRVGVGPGALASWQAETLVAHDDLTARVQPLNVARGRLGPIVYDVGVAAGAAWLVGELPGEDGFRGPVTPDDGVNGGAVLAWAGTLVNHSLWLMPKACSYAWMPP